MSRLRPLLALTAIFAALVLFVGDLDARPSAGGSFGSRGSRTFSAPPATSTAPRAAPLERTITQPTRPGAVANSPTRPAQQAGGLFNRPGLMGGLLAGFLGAGAGPQQQSRGGCLGGLGGGLGGLGMGGGAAAPVESNVELEKEDFDEF